MKFIVKLAPLIPTALSLVPFQFQVSEARLGSFVTLTLKINEVLIVIVPFAGVGLAKLMEGAPTSTPKLNCAVLFTFPIVSLHQNLTVYEPSLTLEIL